MFGPFTSARRRAELLRLFAFDQDDYGVTPDFHTSKSHALLEPKGRAADLLSQAGLRVSPLAYGSFVVLCGLLCAALSTFLVSRVLVPIVFLLGAAIPILRLHQLILCRAQAFSKDYPTMLLATASSVKAGLTPYEALERATRMLAKDNLLRVEVDSLLHRLRVGLSREAAVAQFGSSIRLPELELFRAAFLLVLENGGRFSPTLYRLAEVSNSRATLIQGAEVSTASMRMTANILLVFAPFLLALIAVRTPRFCELIVNDPAANFLASTGALIIIVSHIALKQMSNFRP